MSIAKALMYMYEDDADKKMATSTAGIRKAEIKLRLLSYFPLDGDMRMRLDELSSEIERITDIYARANEEVRIYYNEFGSGDSRTQQKKDTAIALSYNVQAFHTKLETLFIERERQLRDEWL